MKLSSNAMFTLDSFNIVPYHLYFNIIVCAFFRRVFPKVRLYLHFYVSQLIVLFCWFSPSENTKTATPHPKELH